MLIRSIRAGYGSSLLLGSWKFEDGQEGIICSKTPMDFGQWIWENILQTPSDLPDMPSFAYSA